ncbi:MAG: alpha/beta hydrolase family protein [Planctomycetota bacterium]|jgi:dienelactone hydrolase
MASIVLNGKQNRKLQPGTALWKLYAPDEAPLRFKAKSMAEARTWQKRVRRELNQTIGFQRTPRVAPGAKRIEATDKGDYLREKWVIHTGPQTDLCFYLLLPKGVECPPVVLALNGHGYGVKDVVGLWEDGAERDTPDGYHRDFAVALCRQGFAVAAPEISCFGERQNDYRHLGRSPVPTTCQQVAALASHLGGSALGLRMLDSKRLVDYLLTRKDLNARRLGAMGISGGGLHSFFSSILDPRIKATVISGYYSTFRESVLAMHHCPCNFVPGLAQFGEMYDLIGCIAPRPVLVEAGDHDNIFPIAAVKKAVKRGRANYRIFGCEPGIETDYFEGRHRINGEAAYAFLRRQLGSKS